jgi:hypothetical protein
MTGHTSTTTNDDACAQGMKVLESFLDDFYHGRREKIPTRSIAPRVAAPLDPVKVGALAKKFREDQRKAGNEISATEAVAHVLAAGR